ncbi:amino acid permease-domain-containing protein [Diaporthe sp. PMI_573]|nr:amino acid permease-domain-containing protein [Diaporthaceae sp. PMI_573]
MSVSHNTHARRQAGGLIPKAWIVLGTAKITHRVGHKECGYAYEKDDDDVSIDSPTDQTWFLPHSPGLPPQQVLAQDEGKLGVLSAINIIVGKTMGVGAYTVPSAIFSGVGSVGMTLVLWVIGSLISFCGLAVYLDLGTAIPRSGGERVYLERIFRRPYMLATCMFMSYVVLLGFSTPNAVVLGEYALYATGTEPNRWNVRLIATLAVSMLCYVHARSPRLGLRLINTLGVAKMAILVIVVVSGVAGGIMGVGADRESAIIEGRRVDLAMSGSAPSSSAQRNFSGIWEGTSTQPYDYATALLKVIYCFRGYSTANQVLGDVRDPVRTLKVAAPAALAFVSAAYLAVNVAFFLVVDKDEFRSAGVVVAGTFFRKVFGETLGEHVLPLFVVVSAAGNIAATSFAQARVNEELAREGVLPRFWLTDHRPVEKSAAALSPSPSKTRGPERRNSAASASNTHSRGLLLHWLVSVAMIVLPPPGKIYNFLVDIGGYPVSVISVAVSLGLLHLHNSRSEGWTTPCRAPRIAILVSAASNILLLVLPWVPPVGGMGEDDQFPYFTYPATSLGVLGLGALYWFWWRTTDRAESRAARHLVPGGSAASSERMYHGLGENVSGALTIRGVDDDSEGGNEDDDDDRSETVVGEEEKRQKSFEMVDKNPSGAGGPLSAEALRIEGAEDDLLYVIVGVLLPEDKVAEAEALAKNPESSTETNIASIAIRIIATQTDNMSKLINRTTLFKLDGAENQAKLLAAYEKLAKEQNRDGKPYIAYMSAGAAHDDPRSKGYTIVAQSSFYNLDDMKYYDEADASHQELKKTARELGLSEPPLTVYAESAPVIDIK